MGGSQSEAAIRDPDNPAAVFDAQSWAAQARSYADCPAVRASSDGGNDPTCSRNAPPQVPAGIQHELAERAAAQLDDAAGLLDRLGQGSRHERVRC